MKRKYIGLVMGLAAGLVVAALSFAQAAEKPELLSFKPSNLQWEKTKAKFTAPAISTCAGCHPKQYEEWQGSMHAMAFQDPIYLGELNLAIKAVGKEIAKQCEGCHTPAAFVRGETAELDFDNLSPLAKAGVSCDVCHSIKKFTHWESPSHEPENGSFILSPGRENADGSATLTKYGPFPNYEGCGGGFHECVESPKHLTAELCAGCHHVYHYDKHTPYEFTYGEWKKSLYALNGIQCQDCHMVDLETFKRSADEFIKPKRNDYHHYFNGANFLMYFLGKLKAEKEGDEKLAANLQGKYDMAVGRLQAAAEIEIDPMYDKKGDLYKIRVRVHNRRAGHNLPTSLTAVREMWLEVKITDKKTGKVLIESGYLDENGELDGNTHVFNSEGMDMHETFQIDPWKVVSFAKNDLIPPKGYRDINYTILYPPGEGHELLVHAKLRFRQASQYMAQKLLTNLPDGVDLNEWYGLTEIPTVPVVDMTEQNVTVKSTGEPTKLQTIEHKLKKASTHVENLNKNASLYEKLGGQSAVDGAVALFYRKVLADSRVNGFFKDIDMNRQIRMQRGFLTYAFGGPNNYSGNDLRAVHAPLVEKGLNDSHFDVIIELLGVTLKEMGVEDKLIQQAADVANSVRKEVLNK
ncbi:MAG: multiheme c-type cytochrome [Candidatus Electrothrix sp. Rat3]|nr:multiheme c-type cytochrome [Candidatus Electrothrix rattekaaiensis]